MGREMVEITVCICTFRRASIVDALKSVDGQTLPGDVALSVIVADNDETRSAEALVLDTAQLLKTPVTYVHAPARNISIARNACLDAAQGDWVVFFDDDEIAPPDWIAALLQTAKDEQADVVFGAAKAQYDDSVPTWIRARDYHSNIPKRRGGVVQTGHTCNAMMKRDHPAILGERFRLDKGRTGGEDTEFFFRLWRAGAKLAISDEATVYEPVDPKRLSFDWIMKRKYRSGISYGRHALAKNTLFARLKLLITASAKIAFSGLMSLLQFPSKTHRNYWIFRAGFHTGVASSVLNIREQELYG